MLLVDSYLFLSPFCNVMYCFETLFKVPISWLGILHILVVKVNGNDVKPGICVTVNIHAVIDILKIHHLILNRIGTF